MLLPHPNWLDWYRAKHGERFSARGQDFEQYFELVMTKCFPDYENPDPAGRRGDFGCDGLKDYGESAYACYGTRAIQNAERALVGKLQGDFERARVKWDYMASWTFVTNATFGPDATVALNDIRRNHKPGSERPLTISRWNEQRLWDEVVSKIEQQHLNEVFPGVPGAQHIELSDVVPLLRELASLPITSSESFDQVRPVEPTKLDFNGIPADTRIELSSGRALSPAISDWFAGQADPLLEDSIAAKFREIYVNHRDVTSDPKEIVERLYVGLAGNDVRMDSRRAESVYAVTAYFFDSCRIFEEPPIGWRATEPSAGRLT